MDRDRLFKIILVNPANVCSGFAIMTPRWIPVIAGATPAEFASSVLSIDMAIEDFAFDQFGEDDLVAVSIHTLNALRAYQLIEQVKKYCSATVVVGGVHATLFPGEAIQYGADAVVTGDGDRAWPRLVYDFVNGSLQQIYDGGRVDGHHFISKPRWDVLKLRRYLMATVHSTRGCPESCSFCSVWRTDGQQMRLRSITDTIDEIMVLYSYGFRFIVIADDNFYAVGRANETARTELLSQRYALMDALERETPQDITFMTQTTIRSADDLQFLRAMRRARIRGVLVGIESVEEEGLRLINKRFNKHGRALIDGIQRMQSEGIYVLGSHIVGLPSDSHGSYKGMLDIAIQSRMWLAQFVRYVFFPGTTDYELLKRNKHALKIEAGMERYWLRTIGDQLTFSHPTLSKHDINAGLKQLWCEFYSIRNILKRAWHLKLRSPLLLIGYFLVSKIYKTIYYNYGISADSARTMKTNCLTTFMGFAALLTLKSRPRAATELGSPTYDAGNLGCNH